MRTITPKNARLIPETAKRVFGGILFDVYQWDQELFDGSHTTFEMLRRASTVNIFAVKDDKLIVLNQEQPSKGKFYSIPGGRQDNPAENELEAAKRELLEETGMTFHNWRLVMAKQPMSKMEWFIYWFVATDFEKQTEQSLDSGEKIEIQEMALDEVRALVKDLDSNSQLDFPSEIFDNINALEDLKTIKEIGI